MRLPSVSSLLLCTSLIASLGCPQAPEPAKQAKAEEAKKAEAATPAPKPEPVTAARS